MSQYLVRGGHLHLSVISNKCIKPLGATSLPTTNIFSQRYNSFNYDFIYDYSLSFYEINEFIGFIDNIYVQIKHLTLKEL